MIILTFDDGILPKVEASVRRLVAKLSAVTEIKHDIPLRVVAVTTFVDHPDEDMEGFFNRPDGKQDKPWIVVAGQAPTDRLRHVIAHELVHYERWRDGRRDDTERGVDVRAYSLLKQAGYKAYRWSPHCPRKRKRKINTSSRSAA